MIRVSSPLDEKTESIVATVIGCGVNVHRELGRILQVEPSVRA